MPKSVRKVKKDNRWIRVIVPTKFRIGTRKGGTSAQLMSKDQLQEVLLDPSKSKYHSKARTVLANRV